MKELEKTVDLGEQFNSATLWRVAGSAWFGTRVVHEKPLSSPNIKALFTFCPLYAHGSLGESKLLASPASIESSRVGGKWTALQEVIGRMKEYLGSVGGNLDLSVIFANKGVLSGKLDSRDEEVLRTHEQLYREGVAGFCGTKSITYQFYNYDDLGVNFPRFVEVAPALEVQTRAYSRGEGIKVRGEPSRKKIEEEKASVVIHQLNRNLRQLGIPTQVEDSKKNRGIMKGLLHMGGVSAEGVLNLVAGYLAFDWKIPDLVGQNGIYLVTERLNPLFKIADLTKGLEEIPRIEIPA